MRVQHAFGLIVLVALLAVGLDVLAARTDAQEPAASPGDQPVSVSVEPVRHARMVDRAVGYGNLVARRSVRIVPVTPGKVMRIMFADGQSVAAGAPLVLMDTGAAATELAAARRQADTDADTLQRTQLLAGQGLASATALDQARARVAAAQADVALRTTNLEDALLRAPFAGTLGTANVDVGAYVGSNQAIVELRDSSELRVDFRLPSQVVFQLREGSQVRVELPNAGDDVLDGELSFIDPAISTDTRSVLLRAVVANSAGRLRPGLFARVSIDLQIRPDALVVPTVAVTHNLQTSYVFVVDDQGIAHRRVVKPGLSDADQVELLDGVRAGEQVVTTGQFRLRDGNHVNLVPAAAPGVDAG